MDETMYFVRRDLSVSNTRFIAEGQTYPISSVTSAKLEEENPSRTMAILFGVIGLGSYLIETPAAIIIGLVFTAVAIAWATSMKKVFVIVLNTSSGESQAFKSTNREYVELILGAINKSIIQRG